MTEDRTSLGGEVGFTRRAASVVYDPSNDAPGTEEILWAGWQEGELEILKDEVKAKVRQPKMLGLELRATANLLPGWSERACLSILNAFLLQG